MSQTSIFYPVFAQVLLTFILLTNMAVKRMRALKDGEVKISDIALREPNWPGHVTQASNNFLNQFELPLLFYVACIFAFMLQKVSGIFLLLACGFVVARIGHSYVHVTSNYVPKRAYIYFVGALVLFAMWITLFAQLLYEGL